MTDKQYAIKSAKSQIVNEYKNSKDYFTLLRIVGEVVNISQDLELELKRITKKEITFRISIKELIKDLEYFDFPKETINSFITVFECRNWVIHTSLKEYENKRNDRETHFQEILQTIKLFNETEFEKLQERIDSDWKGKAKYIDFDIEPNINNPTVSNRQDWVALKIIIAKHILFEMWDRLNKNSLSIF